MNRRTDRAHRTAVWGVFASIMLWCRLSLAALPSYSLAQLGLTGSGYQYGAAGQVTLSSTSFALNAAGDVIGTSSRYTSSGYPLGQDAWIYNGGTSELIGLTGSGYEYTVNGGTYRYDTLVQLSDSGEAIGETNRYYSMNYSSTGMDAWLFDGTTTRMIGLSGTAYQYVGSLGTVRSTTPVAIGPGNTVAGYTQRYGNTGSNIGSDAWLYDGTTYHPLGLTGSGYSYTSAGTTTQLSAVSAENAGGTILGYSRRYSSTGQSLGDDTWMYDGTSTKVIGLTGGNWDYTPSTGGTGYINFGSFINAQGDVLGSNRLLSSSGTVLGQVAWVYNGNTTQMTGLTGTGYQANSTSGGIIQNSSASAMNASGQVVGVSDRYSVGGNLEGGDAWIYDGTTTKMIGLYGSDYDYPSMDGTSHSVSPTALNDAGQVIGVSIRNNPSNPSSLYNGQDAWIYSNGSTHQIGLIGNGYEYTDVGVSGPPERFSEALAINNARDVIGISQRFGPKYIGNAGWFYDSSTEVDTSLIFSIRSTDKYSMTTPQVLTANGSVLGSYELYSGATDMGPHLFGWSMDDGFTDLGNLVNGGLSAEGWEHLASIYSTIAGGNSPDPATWPSYIVGLGYANGDANGVETTFLATALPEPDIATSLILLYLVILPLRVNRGGACH